MHTSNCLFIGSPAMKSELPKDGDLDSLPRDFIPLTQNSVWCRVGAVGGVNFDWIGDSGRLKRKGWWESGDRRPYKLTRGGRAPSSSWSGPVGGCEVCDVTLFGPQKDTLVLCWGTGEMWTWQSGGQLYSPAEI